MGRIKRMYSRFQNFFARRKNAPFCFALESADLRNGFWEGFYPFDFQNIFRMAESLWNGGTIVADVCAVKAAEGIKRVLHLRVDRAHAPRSRRTERIEELPLPVNIIPDAPSQEKEERENDNDRDILFLEAHVPKPRSHKEREEHEGDVSENQDSKKHSGKYDVPYFHSSLSPKDGGNSEKKE